eukprot:scaffold220235_cov28-Tisochrysis_lutea.AAC.1
MLILLKLVLIQLSVSVHQKTSEDSGLPTTTTTLPVSGLSSPLPAYRLPVYLPVYLPPTGNLFCPIDSSVAGGL